MVDREIIIETFKDIQNNICIGLSDASKQDFLEDNWDYLDGNGGGITRIYTNGQIEKGGVNFSSIEGRLSDKIASKIQGGGVNFFATGVSLVIHPKNPFIPTIHMNIRYIERGGKSWFGGGIDLTPYYPNQQNIIDFHKYLKSLCDKHTVADYSKFKKECDDYFYIKHRKEARGVGGIFFDYQDKEKNDTFKFIKEIGYGFNNAFIPMFLEHIDKPFSDKNREFQLYRRGRYVEFNLVYDRGTLFGLETQGRIESILMSLPPMSSWKYNWSPKPNSEEAKLYNAIKPKDWVSM